MKFLVAGADRVDAGKTTFSVGLLDRTGAVGYKPRAGNDYWYDRDDYRRAAEETRLYGKDAKRLVEASPGALSPETVNPVHRLWRPAPTGGTGLLGREDRSFLLDRVGEGFVVNGTAQLPDEVADQFPVEDAVSVTSLEEFNAVMRRRHAPAMSALGDRIAAEELAVVESYADVARPLTDLEPAAVAVVEPTRVRVYDGPRYVKSCSLASGGPDAGRLEERVPAVTELVEPAETASLPVLGSEERRDPATVANAYESAYDALLAVASDAT